ncbi:AlwI family type II restriction endonuclease [Methanobrevibacter curvatus]|uniref:AlwI restriction endonuclease n=1 Tax=Methanobrevibacter curvatus TaxID=49547 RepID=A0A165ZF21_9EURY|nr:AlwI family type II restriction endonuclease [Methanobrevibacter curvatus]KZX10628.1 AlwI restriction endonuclease [Methanobrevibacter curvatus]
MPKRKNERKPLSFTTTMRNPERIVSFLNCLIDFEGKILTNDLIYDIIKNILSKKIYETVYQRNNKKYKHIYADESLDYTDEDLKDIIKNSSQNHKESGFEKGWPSRFDTFYKFSKELGFVYYEINKKIEISESGHLLIKTLGKNSDSTKLLSRVFLNAMVKYNTNNPFRRNLNSNTPLVLTLETINILKNNYNWEKSGIYRHEIPFITCWQNNNSSKLAEFINSFRIKHGKKPSNETVYSLCLELLESDNTKRFKINQILNEGVDDFIRKFRITGLFSLRGMGNLLDVNKFEIDKTEYVLEKYNNQEIFDDEYKFYEYMGQIDENFVKIPSNYIQYNINEIRQRNLEKWAKDLTKDEIYQELKVLGNKNIASKHTVLKFIDGPIRFEFLTSIALKQHFPSVDISPNYPIDDEGMPTFTAMGGIGDIEVYSDHDRVLVEVTLIRNRNQGSIEIPAITRHLKSIVGVNMKIYSIFIAPIIHEDTKYMIGYTKNRYGLNIYDYTIEDFVKSISKFEKLSDFCFDN